MATQAVIPDTVPSPTAFAEMIAARPYARELRKGNLDLTWFKARPGEGVWGNWGQQAKPSRRGLTLMDCDAASGLFPGPVAPPTTAPRGAGQEPGLPPREWDINNKWEVWADNLVSLYEEACSRQWNATHDIEWGKLEALPPDLERSLCQFMTFLTMSEYLATDALAPWIARFNTYFHEIKIFLATQAMDEARHTEVFRKRLLANGGGLGMTIGVGNALAAMSQPGQAARVIALSPADNPLFSTWEGLSYSLQVMMEGAILSMFRFGEFLGKQDVDKQIFRMVMQDEARHVSYGTMHLKYLLENAPNVEKKKRDLHDLASRAEMFYLDMFFMHPATIESCAILAGGSLKDVGDGIQTYKAVYRKAREEYLSRTSRAGLDRSEQCMWPADLPF